VVAYKVTAPEGQRANRSNDGGKKYRLKRPFSKAEFRVDPPSPSPARVDCLMQSQIRMVPAMMKTKPVPMTR
jgi:hypothetical protein